MTSGFWVGLFGASGATLFLLGAGFGHPAAVGLGLGLAGVAWGLRISGQLAGGRHGVSARSRGPAAKPWAPVALQCAMVLALLIGGVAIMAFGPRPWRTKPAGIVSESPKSDGILLPASGGR